MLTTHEDQTEIFLHLIFTWVTQEVVIHGDGALGLRMAFFENLWKNIRNTIYKFFYQQRYNNDIT